MKILLFPDCHFGYGIGSEIAEDGFELAEEALSRTEPDIILLAGDVFDSRVPDMDTLTRTIKLLLEPVSTQRNIKITAVGSKKQESISPFMQRGIPVIAIHGTHERRAKGLLNPVQAIERSGFLIHLHCNGAVCEKNGESVCIQGMSGVPEQYAPDVLKQWSPKPIENCFNIFLIHQNLKGYVFSDVGVGLEEFPGGFDLYVSGHIHDPQQAICQGKPLIITGSLVPTQLNKESEKPRGFWTIDTVSRKIEFVEFNNQRKVYYKEFSNPSQKELEAYLENVLSKPHEKKPFIRIKMSGGAADLESEMSARYQDNAILSFRKEFVERPEVKTIEEHKLSVQELGKKLLRDNLEKMGLDKESFEALFELLLNQKPEEVMKSLGGLNLGVPQKNTTSQEGNKGQ